jgi:trimeric autotransporter adhesin
MANPTTVLQFATAQNAALTAALQTAQTDLTAKQAAYAAATQARDAAKAALAQTAADMTSLRNQLASVPTPEDANALLASLQADIVKSRQQTGAISNAEGAAVAAQADLAAATAAVQLISTALKASAAALADAATQDARRSASKALLTSAPLSTIVADAAAVLAGTAFVDPANKFKFTDAQNRLQGDLPAALIAEAAQRMNDEIARSAAHSGEYLQAQQMLEAKWTADGGVTGAVTALQSAFNRADAAFTNFVTTANDQFQRAKNALAQAADPTVSPLTAAQKAGINNAAAVAAATTAAAAEKTVDDAVAALAQKQEALDAAILTARSNDADPNTDAGVAAATTARDTAKTALTTAQAAYTATLQGQMTSWEALVPDGEWQLLAAYEQAIITLNLLQNPGPTALLNVLNAAEQALVTGLLAADKSVRTTAALQSAATKQSAIASWETTASDTRRFSALRGDF